MTTPVGPPSPPPAGPPPAGPPPPGPPGLPPEPGGPRRPRPSWLAPVLLVVALVTALLVFTNNGDDGAKQAGVTDTTSAGPGEIFLEPIAATGPDPFAPSVAAPSPPSTVAPGAPVTLGTAPPGGPVPTAPTFGQGPPPPTGGGAAAITPRSGATPGLYGGTRDQASCNQQQMVDFLAANPAKARAFAEVQSISVDEVGRFILSLTPVLLRSDTRVTNHGFANGRPTARQAVLQGGTAVMVDSRGVPRVRCACGNPLLAPEAVASTPVYQGTPWPGFTPSNVTVISPSTTVINIITVIDVVTGAPFGKPTGPGAGPDTGLPVQTTTTLAPPTTLPLVTVPPGTAPRTTLPFASTTRPPATTVPPTLPATTAPPTTAATTTTAPPSTTWTLKEAKIGPATFTGPPALRVTRALSATGGEIILTATDGGTFCPGGGSEDVRLGWSFARSVATIRNGDVITATIQGAPVTSTGGCTGGLAMRTLMTFTGSSGNGSVAASNFTRPIDGDRFGGRGERIVASPASSNTGTVTTSSSPSSPGRPEAWFGFSIELPGVQFFALYIFQQA